MAFNIHITRIGENSASGDTSAKMETINRGRMMNAKNRDAAPSLINVPTDRMINKYPVRIFELQTQE